MTVLETRKHARGFCWNHYMEWRRDNVKRFESECAFCGMKFGHHDAGRNCCSQKCSSSFGLKSANDPSVMPQRLATRQLMVAHLEHECRRPDCYNIYSKMDTDSTHPKYCSQVCFDIIMERATRVSDLNQAVRDKDFQGLVDAIQSRVEISGKGCWVWQGSQKFKKGGAYPVLTISNKTLQLHRVVLELKHGKPLGSQHAHHMCANNRCVNPDHLQPVTHRENMAEMLARQSFLARIRELEDRVRELCPDDPLLNVIEVA